MHYAILRPEDDKPAELVRIDGKSRFEPLATFKRGECPGVLTTGRPAFQSQIVVIHCIGRLPPSKHNSKHYWSEVFDLKRTERWRTKYFVLGVSASGAFLVTRSRRWTSSSKGDFYAVRFK